LGLKPYLATGYKPLMKRILSEKNFAALLFVMVLIAFAFAHEDSKKRDIQYSASSNSLSNPVSSASKSLSAMVQNVTIEKSLR